MTPRAHLVLLVIVPASWDPVPEGIAALRQCLTEAYGAGLIVHHTMASLLTPLPLYTGYWDLEMQWCARQDVPPLLAEAFVDLRWFDAELEAG